MSTQAGSPPAAAVEEPVETGGLRRAVGDYVAKVRSGDIGSLSSVLGVVVLVILFTVLNPGIFDTPRNFANLLNQSAAVIFIAMGLVFVLLLGEIDLSAGYTAGTSAAVLGVLLSQGAPWWVAVLACLATGALIGLLIGLLVALLGIPSFVVTLAAFLGLQGVLLLVIGNGGTIPVRDPVILRLMNSNLPVWGGWVFWALVVGGFVVLGLVNQARRRRAGLPTGNTTLFWAGAVGLAVLLAVAVYVLNLERAVNVDISSLRGVPVVVPVAALFLVGLAFVLDRTRFGRHVYAVGGNAEAARRSGINVARVRIACFMIGSTMAAVAGILLASRDNSISPSTGGAQTLLFAVGAAVIGGVSLFGGKGKVHNAILGGLVIAVIANGLPLVTSEAGIQFVVTGAVLLLAASVDAISRRKAVVTR
ncbi:sugar ABC transporter permease [Aquipuribacter hungaricus]|uniref:Xylose transport system permease protein XylH n=1 Tax=Aquipuribacter hungaricus TaxID=545624 RepID=A0ABV7WD05_9MICO